MKHSNNTTDVVVTQELDPHLLERVDKKRQEQLVWVAIEDIIGFDDVPNTKRAFRESVSAHQTSPILLNKATETSKKYEMVDGRGRTTGRAEEGKKEVLAIIYIGLTDVEKAMLSRIPHEGRRENYIHLYRAIEVLRDAGIHPVEIQDIRLKMKKSLYDKMCRIDLLIPEFKDAFLSNDAGFGFTRAMKVSKLSHDMQHELFLLYSDEGKLTNEDIRNIKQAKASQDIQDMFSPELLKELDAKGQWKPKMIELLRRVDLLCPRDDEFRQVLLPALQAIDTLKDA